MHLLAKEPVSCWVLRLHPQPTPEGFRSLSPRYFPTTRDILFCLLPFPPKPGLSGPDGLHGWTGEALVPPPPLLEPPYCAGREVPHVMTFPLTMSSRPPAPSLVRRPLRCIRGFFPTFCYSPADVDFFLTPFLRHKRPERRPLPPIFTSARIGPFFPPR